MTVMTLDGERGSTAPAICEKGVLSFGGRTGIGTTPTQKEGITRITGLQSFLILLPTSIPFIILPM